MTRQQAHRLIESKALGPETASVLGKLSARILDHVTLPSGYLCVCTPRLGWHFATPREYRILHRGA